MKEEITFHQRVVDLQAQLKAPKGQFNAFGKYKYRSCEDILEGVKPHLKDSELILTITDDVILIGERYYFKATATLLGANQESLSVSSMARESLDKKGMDSSQISGTASSYARKYALNGLLCIDDTKDSDSADNSQKSEKPSGQIMGHQGGKDFDDKASEKQVKMLMWLLNEKYNKSIPADILKAVGFINKSKASEKIEALKKELNK